MSKFLRHMLSEKLYEEFKDIGNNKTYWSKYDNENKFRYQVPFVDKEGNTLPDEDCEDISVTKGIKELLEAGASPLFYLIEEESFLLPYCLRKLQDNIFHDKEKEDIINLLFEHISRTELENLLPEHSNMLIQQMLYVEGLDNLLNNGLKFKQDLENRYGEDAIEIKAIKRKNTEFFKQLINHGSDLNFDLIYQKGEYKETTLRSELQKIEKEFKEFIVDNNYYDRSTHQEEYDRISEFSELMNKWLLKNKIESKDFKAENKKTNKI